MGAMAMLENHHAMNRWAHDAKVTEANHIISTLGTFKVDLHTVRYSRSSMYASSKLHILCSTQGTVPLKVHCVCTHTAGTELVPAISAPV